MKLKRSSILKESGEIRGFIEKNHKVPKSCTFSDGTILSPYSAAYLMSSVIKNPKLEYIGLQNVIAYNEKHNDTINEKVRKEDYLFMIDNFIKFCHEKKRVPAYVTTKNSKTKVSFELFLYGIAKIANYYKEKGRLPEYCEFNKSVFENAKNVTVSSKKEPSKSTSTNKKTNNCTNPYTSKPHLYDENKGQDTPNGCANNAEQQSFYKLLGKVYKESELAKLSATTSKGTSHDGINTCIAAISKKTGVKLTVKWVNFSDLGKTTAERFEALAKIICKPNKAVITHIKYINGGKDPATKNNKGFGHYETIDIIDTKRKVVRVINSLGLKKPNGGYVGKTQERPYTIEASYLAYTSGGQKAICIITKG